MGTTFIRYNGKEFEANDSQAEIWLLLLVEEIERLAHIPNWLLEARDHWREEAREGYTSGVFPDLDGLVGSDQGKRRELLVLCDRAMVVLRSLGPEVSREFLNHLTARNRAAPSFTDDLPTLYFTAFGEHFTKLVQGTLEPGERDVRPGALNRKQSNG